jgi:hypothetical protein
MTTYAEIEALVVAQTRRPDVQATTATAIRTATLRAHHVDFFPRDLTEHTLFYTPSSTAQFYEFPNVTALLPRLRSIKLVRCLDSVTSVPVEQLEWREVDDLYDNDGNRRQSVYLLIGDTLKIGPQQATGAIATFYYRNPQVSGATYSSWIADTYPDELAMWAAAIVFARLGYAEMAQDFQRNHVQPFKELLTVSHLLGAVN